jgi:hypothetical protein
VVLSSSACQNPLLNISTPLSSRFHKASNMIKRESNENDNDNGNVNKNDQNKTVIENYGNGKFENLTTNISSKNNLKRNDIIDANQNDINVPKLTSTSLNTSILKLYEDTKNEKIKSKFIIPVRKECSSSSLNRTECSLEVLKNTCKTDDKEKNEKGVKNTNVDQNITHDVSTKIIQKRKTNTLISEVVKKSNDLNTNKTDDQKQLTKKGKAKKQKDGDGSTSTKSGKIEVTRKVDKVDKKGKRKIEVLEEIKDDLEDNNDNDNVVCSGHGNIDDKSKNKKDEVKSSNKNTKNDKSDDKFNNNKNTKVTKNTKDMTTVKDNSKNANEVKGKKKNDIEKEDDTKESDKVDTAITIQSSSTIPRKNKTAAAAVEVEVVEDSKMTEAMKNVPRKALLTSELPKKCSSEEDVLSDDDSLSLGSEESYEMEEDEEKREENEIEVMNEGRSKKKGDNDRGNVDEQKHLTPNRHQDADNNKNNSNDKEDDDNSDDEDDMFFAE